MKLIALSILFFVLACNSPSKDNRLTGDLYFGLFRIGSYYNQPDSLIAGFERYIDTINYETADKDQRKFVRQFRRLKEEGLMYNPFVQIKDASDSILTVYLEKPDYDRIKIYKRKDLQSEGKRIDIEAEVIRVDEGMFYCSKLLKVEKLDGETSIKSNKWRVDDYN